MSRLIDAEHFEQMLIDLIDHGDHKNAYVHHAYKMRNIAIKECRNMLWEEPTVDAVPVVHGHWEMKWNIHFHRELPACSCCRKFVAVKFPHCPLCGAKMDLLDINVGNKDG